MSNRWARAVIAIFLAEAAPILALIIAVAVFGPHDAAGDQAFAERMGAFIGPIGGALFTFLAAFWATRILPSGKIAAGAAIGAGVVAIDALILVAGGVGFIWLFALSWAGRLIAGTAGGLLAGAVESEDRRPNEESSTL